MTSSSKSSSHILISGGAGFIGTSLARKLKKTHRVTIFDNFSEQIHGNRDVPRDPDLSYYVGDVRSDQDWNQVLATAPDAIIHLAAETGTGQSMDLINHYFSVNVNGTATMVEAIQRNKSEVKHIILSSSRAVYGAGVNSEDNKVLDPLSIYGVTKLVQEQCLKLSSPSPLTILRFQNVYGPGQSLINSYTGIISIFFERMRKNLPISIYDKGLPTRDFVFVEDISDAIIACLFNAKAIGKTYNVGTGKKQLILEVAQILKTLLGSSSEISVTDYHRPGDVIAIDSHVDLISAELGWKHKVEVQEGLRKFIEWALAEHAAS